MLNKSLNSVNIIFLSFIIGSIVGIIILSIVQKSDNLDEYDTATEYIRELEMSYYGVKSDLINEVQTYIDSVSPDSGLRALILVEECEKVGFPISFALAQGELESHFGTKGLAARTNSIWNVGAFDGQNYDNISHKYKNPNNSIKPYLDLLINSYIPNKTIEDLLDNFVDINGNRYASNTHYEEMLRAKYRNIQNNSKIDSLQSRLNYYKVRLN